MSSDCLDKFEKLLKIQADIKKDINIEIALEGLILAINELNTAMYSRIKEIEISKEAQYIIRSYEGLNSKEGLYLIDEVDDLLKKMIIYEDEINNQIIDLYKKYVDSIKLNYEEREFCDCKEI